MKGLCRTGTFGWIGALLAAGALATTACTVTTEGAPGASTRSGTVSTTGEGSLCNAYCTKLNTCDASKDKDTCENKCANANAATLPKLRADIIGEMNACIEGKDCSKVLKGDVLTTCAQEAAAAAAPSAAATDYCDALQATANKCDLSFNRAGCLSSAKLFNDDAIAEAKACTQKACSDVAACVNAALGSLGASSSSSSSSGEGGSTSPSSCSAVGNGKKFDFNSATCDSCMSSSCCSQATACANDTSCSAYWSCLLSCTSTSCESSCASKYASGVSKLGAVQSCFTASCKSACG